MCTYALVLRTHVAELALPEPDVPSPGLPASDFESGSAAVDAGTGGSAT